MGKQAVKVVIRSRPTDNFASQNIKIDTATGVRPPYLTLDPERRPTHRQSGRRRRQQQARRLEVQIRPYHAQREVRTVTYDLSSQDQVYEVSAGDIVQSVVQGYNGTILCYGQTGAGKTFTMTGSTSNFKYRGLVPRAINQIFNEIGNKFDQAITIRVSYVEIYNELMFDLLSPIPTHEQQSASLQIQDDSRGGVAIKGLSMLVCETEEDALNHLF